MESEQLITVIRAVYPKIGLDACLRKANTILGGSGIETIGSGKWSKQYLGVKTFYIKKEGSTIAFDTEKRDFFVM
jgi:hypothetical protein